MCILLNVKKHEKTFALNVDIFTYIKNAKKDLQRMIIYGTLQKVSLANIFMYVCL